MASSILQACPSVSVIRNVSRHSFGLDVVELNPWNYQRSSLLAYGYFCSDHWLASCAYICVLLFWSLASILCLFYAFFCSGHSLASCAYLCVLLFWSLANILSKITKEFVLTKNSMYPTKECLWTKITKVDTRCNFRLAYILRKCV